MGIISTKILITVGDSCEALHWRRESITIGRFYDRLRQVVRTSETRDEYLKMSKAEQTRIKDVGGFVGGTFEGSTRSIKTIQTRTVITLDFDNIPAFEGGNFIRNANDVGASFCIYSTHKHTEGAPRLRFCFPTDRPMLPEEYAPVARRVAHDIDSSMMSVDPASFTLNQLMFYPSTCKDIDFVYECNTDDPLLCVDEVLQSYADEGKDWRNCSSWNYCPDELAKKPKKIRTVNNGTKNGIRVEANTVTDPRSVGGVIGAFCKSFSIPDAILNFLPDVYTIGDHGRYTYIKGSTSNGAILYGDADQWLYSHHGTDPAGGQLCNAFDLVRIHKYAQLDEGTPQDTAAQDLPSFHEMMKFAMQQDAVQAILTAFTPADYTDMHNAELFARNYGSVCRYSDLYGWLAWNGCVWDTSDAATKHRAMTFCAEMLEAAKEEQKRFEKKQVLRPKPDGSTPEPKTCAFLKHARASCNKNKIDSFLALAPSVKRPGAQFELDLMRIKAEELDANPYDLNTPGGLVDLNTGKLRPSDPNAFCTRMTSVAPDTDHNSPGWKMFRDFLDKLTTPANDGCSPEWTAVPDVDLQNYLQMVLGSMLIGQVKNEVLYIAEGGGANGKSTLFDCVQNILGTYAGGIDPDALLAKSITRGAYRSDLAQLRGKRYVVTGELKLNDRIDEATIKRVCSTGKINAKLLYHNAEDFLPSHHILMYTNILPRVSGTDSGTWRRLVVMPFHAAMPKGKDRILNFAAVLAEKAGGAVLQWIIEGAARYLQTNADLTDAEQQPDCVREVTAQYREREDWFKQFVDACCIISEPGKKQGTVKMSDLIRAYERHAAEEGDPFTHNRHDIEDALLKINCTPFTTHNQKAWRGIELNEDTKRSLATNYGYN